MFRALSINLKMYRIPRPEKPRLVAMIDERDHLRIQLSLVADNPDKTEHVAELSAELAALDREIQRMEAAERSSKN